MAQIETETETGSPKMSTVKNPTFTFYLTQIQVVPFQCNHFFLFKTARTSNMGLKLS